MLVAYERDGNVTFTS